MGVSSIGRYEILKTLGRGATGVVYLAHDPIIDRDVALKTLRIDLDADSTDELRERFLREARAAGRLSHPGIVTVHDVGEDPATGLVFIAMEFVEGRNLKEILAESRLLPPQAAARLVAAVASALAYAHRMGVVHRDVKPANILITNAGVTKITDFGIARLDASNLTVDGQFLGTPNYMSPEQVTGGMVDGRSDLFSLGVVLFELLTGQRPFPGATLHEVTRAIVDASPPIPSVAATELPPTFNPIVLKCLEKVPEKRFQNGDDLAAVLLAMARSLAPGGTSAGAAGIPTGHRPGENAPTPDVEDTLVSAPSRRTSWHALLARLPLPEPLHWEVATHWAITVVAAWVVVWAALLGGLAALRDEGPFPAPDASAILGLHQTSLALRRALATLPGDPAAAAVVARSALDQAPASPAARRVIEMARRRLAEQVRSENERRRGAELVSTGRQLYRKGRFGEAAELFAQALELNPADELASSFLELTREHLARRTVRVPSRPASAPVAGTPRSVASAAGSVASDPARLTLYFNSPLNAGTMIVSVDGASLGRVPFDFTRKGFLGLKKKGAGQVKQTFTVPAGSHSIDIELVAGEQGPVGSASFTRNMPSGSAWTLRVDMPGAGDHPSFFLVRAAS